MTEIPADRQITDDTLGTFVRGVTTFSSGDELIDSYFSQKREIDGVEILLWLDTADPAEAHRLLPRLVHVVERCADLRNRAVGAIVDFASPTPPTDADLADADADLELNTIVVEGDGEVILHFSDLCGKHLLDGYWPAVRFAADDAVVEVTIEA